MWWSGCPGLLSNWPGFSCKEQIALSTLPTVAYTNVNACPNITIVSKSIIHWLLIQCAFMLHWFCQVLHRAMRKHSQSSGHCCSQQLNTVCPLKTPSGFSNYCDPIPSKSWPLKPSPLWPEAAAFRVSGFKLLSPDSGVIVNYTPDWPKRKLQT